MAKTPRKPKPSKTPRRRRRTRPPARRSALRRLLRWGAAGLVWALLAIAALVGWWALHLPDPTAAATRRPPAVTVLAADGSVLASYGALHGPSVHFDALPPALIAAVMAAEDRRFFDHGGIDLVGIARAAIANLRAGAVVQGGSTITQQIAKNLFLTPQRTLKRKVQEALLALWLERRFSKRELMAIYLNRVYLGAGVWGVEAAARRYFNKPASALTLPEAAMIAGLPKAPSRYNPAADAAAAEARAAVVIDAMVAAGFIDKTEADAAKAGPATAAARPAGGSGRYAADWALARALATVGAAAGDLTVATTIDPGLQREAAAALAAGLALAQGAEGALVSMAPDGAVLAMVGGSDYARTPFNRALEARRQPGSAFKLFVYLAALEAGMTPDDRVEDAPLDIDGWRPGNFNGRFEGEMTLTRALTTSVNTVAARIAWQLGMARVVEAARRLGIGGALPAVPSLALGTAGTTPLELTAAYAVLAHGGLAVRPHVLAAIHDGEGQLLYRRAAPPARRIVAARVGADLVAMLAAAVAAGSGRAAQLPGRQAAGKTGTSQDHRDGWFVGFTRQLATGVWIGRDDGAPVADLTGGGLPAAVWADYMAAAHRGLPALPLIAAAPPEAAPPQADSEDGFGALMDDLLGETDAEPSGDRDR